VFKSWELHGEEEVAATARAASRMSLKKPGRAQQNLRATRRGRARPAATDW
jgi:hypothetical protein